RWCQLFDRVHRMHSRDECVFPLVKYNDSPSGVGYLVTKAVQRAAPALFLRGTKKASRAAFVLRDPIELFEAALQCVKCAARCQQAFNLALRFSRGPQPLDEN